MKTIVIIATLLLTTTIASLKSTLKRMIKFKIKTKSKPIDEDFIQEIVNGITNGLVPRIILAKICQDYFLSNTAQAALSGDSVVKSLEIDLALEKVLHRCFHTLAKANQTLWSLDPQANPFPRN